MERLTKRSENLNDKTTAWFIDRENGNRKLEPCEMNPHHSGVAIRRLAEYEDAEEQGLLFKLPVAIGDIVYRINEHADNPLIPMGVVSVEIKGIANTFNAIKCKECIFGGEFTYRFSDIGKTLFITKEDAEKFLQN